MAKLTERYDSLAHAATSLGVPVAVLKRAKEAGAPGFIGHRVYPSKLLPWLKSNKQELEGDGEDKNQLQCRKLRAECERIETENQEFSKTLVSMADVEAWQTQKAEELKRLLPAKLVNEMLPKLTGLMVPEMTLIAKGYIAQIVSEFRKPFRP